ncbi:MAG: hypothetical protein ACPGLV_13770 [Bacteroidia bacterium]
MASWHLIEIENALNRIGWNVINRLIPDPKNNFIGGWIIKRSHEREVEFDGVFDAFGNIVNDPTLDKVYGCQIKGTEITLYF